MSADKDFRLIVHSVRRWPEMLNIDSTRLNQKQLVAVETLLRDGLIIRIDEHGALGIEYGHDRRLKR